MSALMEPLRQGVSRPARAARLVTFKPAPRSGSTLFGYASVDFDGWVVNEIPLFRTADGGLSVGVPTAPDVGADGRQRERDGKRQYRKILTFTTQEARARYQRVVLAAVMDGGFVP